jgi:chemotaxis protein CheZ
MACEIEQSNWGCEGRGVQKKVFRVEQMLTARSVNAIAPRSSAPAKHADDNDGTAVANLKRELAAVQDIIARNKRDLASLIGEGTERRMARAGDELRAAVDGMDDATQNILKSVEIIDESARALTATLKDEYKRGLAQDIQDNVVKVYEACNFQDIVGQRITNVIGTMTMVEDQVAGIVARCDGAEAKNHKDGHAQAVPAGRGGLLNGPKLDGDAGQASQIDVDKMFA